MHEITEFEAAVIAQLVEEQEANGISNAELARRAEMDVKTLARKKSGERQLTFGELERLATALRIDALDLIAKAGQRMEEPPRGDA